MSRPLWGHPVGHDDLTDAPNFGTKFGRRRPCPRYGVPPQVPALAGGGAADEGRRLARGYSFQIKRISPRTSQERFPGGWRRHKLHIPRRRQKGTGSLIPLLLLFPPQTLRWFAAGALFSPRDPLETTKGGQAPLWKPLFGDGRGCFLRWDGGRERRRSKAGCVRSFRAFCLVGDEVGEGLVVLAPTLGG